MLNKYKILKTDFSANTYVNFAINLDNKPIDYYSNLNNFIQEKAEENVNPIDDFEKYIFNFNTPLKIKLLFYDKNNDNFNFNTTYNTSTTIIQDDYAKRKNSILKSFIRINFYENFDERSNKLLFFEDFMIKDLGFVQTTEFFLDKIYWYKNDPVFKTNANRIIYFNINFFNAKTGKIHRFLNLPLNKNNGITDIEYINNINWRYTPLLLLNPLNNNNINRVITSNQNPNDGSLINNNITLKELNL
jgi:hypothetical protein